MRRLPRHSVDEIETSEEQESAMIPKWLEWGQRLQALAQTGLNYTENPFEIERY